MLKLNVNQIKANTWNCNFLDEQEKQTLKQHMNQNDPKETVPVVVRKIIDTNNYWYELVDGEQRWTIAKELGWTTINAIECTANDLESRVLCVGYNRIRGRINWFKLHEVIKKDANAGIDVAKAYREVLPHKELEWLLSLDNLVPKARLTLEEALKKHPEISLEQLHLLALFPADQQEELVDNFKTPIVIPILKQILGQQNQTRGHPKDTALQTTPEKTIKTMLPKTTAQNISETSKAEQTADTHQSTPQKLEPQTEEDLRFSDRGTSQTELGAGLRPDDKPEIKQALLVAVSYLCDCGRQYHANFKKSSIVVQKQNLLFEHVDYVPHTFLTHCSKCSSDHEFVIDNAKREVSQIYCRRCKPPREGLLDVNTGEVTWFNC